MRKSPFSESQIVSSLREAKGGAPVAELPRKQGHQPHDVAQVSPQVRRGESRRRETAARS